MKSTIKMIETIGALDVRLAALIVLAIIAVSVTVIAVGLDR